MSSGRSTYRGQRFYLGEGDDQTPSEVGGVQDPKLEDTENWNRNTDNSTISPRGRVLVVDHSSTREERILSRIGLKRDFPRRTVEGEKILRLLQKKETEEGETGKDYFCLSLPW